MIMINFIFWTSLILFISGLSIIILAMTYGEPHSAILPITWISLATLIASSLV